MWELFAAAVIFISVILFILYDDGRYFLVLISSLFSRLLLIPIFTSYTTGDVSDYLPYFIEFTNSIQQYGIIHGIVEFFSPHVPFYTLLYPGYIYTAFGEGGLIVIRIFNASLSLAILPILNEINKMVFNSRFKRWQAGLVLFWPSYVFFSIEVGRTVPSVLFVCFSVYAFLRMIDHVSFWTILTFGFALGTVIMIRIYYVAYIFILLAVSYAYKTYWGSRKYIHIATTGIIAAISYYIGTSLFPYQFTIDRINSLAKNLAHGDSAYLTTVYPETSIDLIWYIPLQGAYFQFSPFIWDIFRINSQFVMVAAFQSIFMVFILFLVAFKIKSQLIGWRFWLVILTAIAVPFVLGVGVKNAGSAMRWRLPTDLLIIALASTVIDREYLHND
jgi:hypothetical protein